MICVVASSCVSKSRAPIDPKVNLYPFLVTVVCATDEDQDERTSASFELLIIGPHN